MANTPTTPFRISHDVKGPAQAKAERLGETLTDVVIRALIAYADEPEPTPAPTQGHPVTTSTTHRPIIRARRLRGTNRNGTGLTCSCGTDFGVVSNEAVSSRLGKETARARHAMHVDEVEPSSD